MNESQVNFAYLPSGIPGSSDSGIRTISFYGKLAYALQYSAHLQASRTLFCACMSGNVVSTVHPLAHVAALEQANVEIKAVQSAGKPAHF
jgi:hypothetical protein